MRRYVLVISATLLLGCEDTENESSSRTSNDVIEFAEVITYNDLTDEERSNLRYCCSYYDQPFTHSVSFDKENAYYVRARINADLLAEISASETFSKSVLLNKEYGGASWLYGKYKNRWKFVNEQGYEIPPTEKFSGHNIISIARKELTDYVVVGALPEKPSKMLIELVEPNYHSAVTTDYSLK